MIKSYLKIAWRNLIKNKASSFINISGLAVGMAVAMLIGLWIWDELSFDKYHKNYDSIAQAYQQQRVFGNVKTWEHLPYPLVNELQTSYGGDFKHIIPAMPADECLLSAGQNKITQKGQYIGAAAPDMLTLKMISGSRGGLNDPHSILLSASVAKALFGEKEPLDQVVKMSGIWDASQFTNLKVTGVYEDLPQNTQFHETQFFLPWGLYEIFNPALNSMTWDNHRFLIYVQLPANTDFAKVNADIRNAELRVIRQLGDMKTEAATKPEIVLNPMRNWHLYSNYKDGVADKGPVEFIWIVSIIGCFVLVLACINFINLSTARSEKKAVEVGIRKAIGSARKQLITQFFMESFLVVIFAFGIALVLTTVSLPLLNELAGKQIILSYNNPWFWVISVGFILLTGVLAGAYPALYLSAFNPVKVLKGSFRAGRLAAIPRKVLVITQFTVSIALIVCTIIIRNQLMYGKSRPVGYSRDGLVAVPMKSIDFLGKYEILRSELKNTGAVAEVAESESPLTGVSSSNAGFTWKGKDPGTEEKFGTLMVTPEYGKTIGWQFVDGRDFSRQFKSDTSGFVINKAAAKYMGLHHPVGENIHWISKWNKVDQNFKVIGVIKDMVMESPFAVARPTIFRLGGNDNYLFIRINPQVSAGYALPKIAAVFKKITPAIPFEYTFADEGYAKKFAAEEHIGKLTTFFAGLAIFISCLGLFGMASFMAEQRTKEIGIRKVLGASIFNLWRLLTNDFLGLIVIALLIASPIAYYFMQKWLQGYEYRTGIAWWIFAVTAIGAMFITLLTVSYQSIKAALANPVKSLKSE